MKISDLEKNLIGKARAQLRIAKAEEAERVAWFETRMNNARKAHTFLDKLASREPIRKYASFLKNHTGGKGILVHAVSQEATRTLIGIDNRIYLEGDGLAHFYRQDYGKPLLERKVVKGIYVKWDQDIIGLFGPNHLKKSLPAFKKETLEQLTYCLPDERHSLSDEIQEKLRSKIPNIVEYVKKNYPAEYLGGK